MNEKFGTIIVDGKIVDLDRIPLDELDEVISKLEKEQEKIREEIDQLSEIQGG